MQGGPLSDLTRRTLTTAGIASLVCALTLATGARAEVLRDQYGTGVADPIGSSNATTSQDFEPSRDAYDDLAADDFLVESEQIWQPQRLLVQGFARATSAAAGRRAGASPPTARAPAAWHSPSAAAAQCRRTAG